MKECFTCKEMKPLDAYCKRRTARDGRNGVCRTCEADREKRSHLKLYAYGVHPLVWGRWNG